MPQATCFVVFFLVIAMVACSPAPPVQPVAQAEAPSQETHVATLTQAPTVTRSPTLAPTALPSPTITPTPEPVFTMCSPLVLHPLEELAQIIGDPYKPPPPGREERHHGVDFGYYHYMDRDSMLGEPVQVVLPGVVAASIEDRFPYGNMVIIEIPQSELPAQLVDYLEMQAADSLYILFAHMNLSPLVKLGERVVPCQPLGEVGMSGNTDIPHLHLETRLGPAGVAFESMRFYDTRATVEEMENYVRWRTGGEFRHFDPMTLFTFPLDTLLPK